MRKLCGLSLVVALVVATLGVAASPAGAVEFYVVTSGDDSGPGTLREALDLADSDDADSVITFAPGVDTVALTSGRLDVDLTEGGTESFGYSLTILGAGVTIMKAAPFTDAVLRIRGPLNVTLRHLSLVGNGAPNGDGLEFYSDNTGGPARTLLLDRVTSRDNGPSGYGVYIDQVNAVDLTVMDSVIADNGSDGIYLDVASAKVRILSSSILRNDDGLVVAVYDGDADVTILDSLVRSNERDGVEVDGDSDGSVEVIIGFSTFDDNGFEFGTESGVEIVEEDGGTLDVIAVASRFDGNADDGLYVEEGGSGDMTLRVFASEANGNGSDGYQVREEDSGSTSALFLGADATGNASAGIEADGDAGFLLALFSDLSGNAGGETDISGLPFFAIGT